MKQVIEHAAKYMSGFPVWQIKWLGMFEPIQVFKHDRHGKHHPCSILDIYPPTNDTIWKSQNIQEAF